MLFTVISCLCFFAHLDRPIFAPGVKVKMLLFFTEEEIPWDQLAFSTVKRTLHHYFSDRKKNEFPVRLERSPCNNQGTFRESDVWGEIGH